MSRHYLAKRSQLDDGRLMVDLPDGEQVLLIETNGKMYAVGAMCPHQYAPLIGGDVDDEAVLTCPLHGWRFSLKDGQDPDNPHSCVPTWPCGEDADGIWVDPEGRQGDVW
ncbi:MAG: Rieske (2Fe-2S) protein [Myxococcales bacterium]|nr:Rieske (2Fe-2S) protein [Myxococcales bacterium]